MQAQLKEKNDIKIFILYLMRNIGYPLDFSNINDIVVQDGIVNYFDFAEFGAHMADEKSGQFVNGGFIFCDVEDGLDSIMEKLEDESSSMTMGGM